MRKERKEYLLSCFPVLSKDLESQMHGKGAQNFVVFLTNGDELFARCYHRYSKGGLIERQRYVFAKDGAVRYGKDDGRPWTIRSEFREPVFCAPSYGYTFDNTYTTINTDAIKQSCMKYAHAEQYHKSLLMEYMKLYCQHPNVEYIVKSGYEHLIDEHITGYWGCRKVLYVNPNINWKSNNLLKMLGLNRTEFKLLNGSEGDYDDYIRWRERYPKYKPAELLSLAKAFGLEFGTCERFTEITGVKPTRLARYLDTQQVRTWDYSDYLDQCRILKYDLHDTAICMPYDFNAMHARLSALIRYESDEMNRKLFAENYEMRKALEYSSSGFIIRQPKSMDEIAAEGTALNHCVGGYAERHANGKLHILFIRTADKPDVPYYTMELSVNGKIVQVRGLRNCDMTPEVEAFVEQYKLYISEIFNTKERKTA